jgi:hypothetical protein
MTYVIRALIIATALFVLAVTPLVATTESGTTIVPIGLAIDVLAIAAVGAAFATWRRRREGLGRGRAQPGNTPRA